MMNETEITETYQILQKRIAVDPEIPVEAKEIIAVVLDIVNDIHMKLHKISEK